MTSTTKKAIVLFFIACTLQVQVVAWSELTGKLRTQNNKAITVNSHKAKSGTSVPSGSDIQCPEKIGATVELGALGRIDMAAKTDLRLGFDAYGVTVHLRSGYVVLTTNKGIAGIVTTSEGKMLRTDSSKLSSVTVRTKDTVDSEPVGAGSDDSDNSSPAKTGQ